jgi:hypothetical protein
MDRARESSLSCRVVERNSIAFPVSMDYFETRLNLALRNGKVMLVTRG